MSLIIVKYEVINNLDHSRLQSPIKKIIELINENIAQDHKIDIFFCIKREVFRRGKEYIEGVSREVLGK